MPFVPDTFFPHFFPFHRHSSGSGHVYQGRFKSFPVQEDEHFYTVARYVERNALHAKLVRRAEEWTWSSLFRWQRGSAEVGKLLSAWPVPRRSNTGQPSGSGNG